MLTFYMDHNFHAAITAGLRSRRIDCMTALEDGMNRADDSDILQRATELGRVLLSHDHDLLAVTHGWLAAGREFSGLVFGAPFQITIGGAIGDLEMLAVLLNPDEMRNRIEYLPL